MRPVFNAEQIAWCTEQLATFADVLNEYPSAASATPDYHLMADGIVWSDEYIRPLGHNSDYEFNKFFCVVVNIRTSQIKRADIGEHAENLMTQLRDRCDRWAFCEARRFDTNLDCQFEKLKDDAWKKLMEYPWKAS